MPSFVHYPLLWGLLIVGVPVLIHLINMLRHRRVEWAAMEFLLVSQKKNRTWILLKQLLLLLLRMLAVAAVVLIVAQPLLQNRFGSLLGGGKTHHIVLLDDSFSMSDRWADTSAFAEAKRVVERIGAKAGRQVQPQTFTLIRFSQVGRASVGTQPDLLEEAVDTEFITRLRKMLDPFEPSHLAAGPIPALEAIVQLLGETEGEQRIIYLISDFRARQWEDPVDLRNRLAQLNEMDAKLRLVNCVETARPNLAITGLVPGEGTRAAGVPLFMEVTVKNFGTTPVKEVPVLLEADDQSRPAIRIAKIPPGEAVTERFPVHFPTAGEHQISARLEIDAVACDDFRYSVVDFPVDLPVLLVDAGPDSLDARYLSATFAPGGPVSTGINPRIEKPRYLSVNPLNEFRAIYLLNVDRLDTSAIEALEEYVAAGGGVGVFLGEQCRGQFINEQLYREGKGFFPVPVTGPAELLVDRLQKAPDLEVSPHPIFRIFAGKRNSFISTVIVQRYFAVPKGWQPAADSKTQVIARLRNGAPVAVERDFGEGRVVAMLTTAAPVWNNWARNNPSFVVAMLEMQAFLSREPALEVSKLVGSPLELQLDPDQYAPQVRFSTPGEDATPVAAIDAVPTPGGPLAVALPDTDTSGVYQAKLIRQGGAEEVRRFAFNVEAEEGDLKALGGPELASRLEGIRYDYDQAAMFEYTDESLAGYNLSEFLLYLLILILIGEQILAWSASYHPPSRRQQRAKGGVR